MPEHFSSGILSLYGNTRFPDEPGDEVEDEGRSCGAARADHVACEEGPGALQEDRRGSRSSREEGRRAADEGDDGSHEEVSR